MGQILKSINQSLKGLNELIKAPEDAKSFAPTNKILSVFIILMAYFSWIIWWMVGLDSTRSPIQAILDPSNKDLLFGNYQKGSFWFSLILIILSIVFFSIITIIPGTLAAKRAGGKRSRASVIIASLMIGTGIRLPLYLGLSSIPALIINTTMFSGSDSFIISAIWISGGALGILDTWRISVKIVSSYYIAAKKGLIYALISSILGIALLLIPINYGGF